MKLKKLRIFLWMLSMTLFMIPATVKAEENELPLVSVSRNGLQTDQAGENELPIIPGDDNIKQDAIRLSVPEVKLSVKKSSGKPVISWEKVNDASKYQVQYKIGKNGTYQTLAVVNNLKITHKDAAAGKKYYYRVAAVGDGEQYIDSDYSKAKAVVCDCAAPVIKVKRNADGNPVISWKKVDSASKYKIFCKSGSKGKYKKLATTKKKSYTHKKAAAGKKYYYKVVAINRSASKGNSAYSNVKSIQAK